MPFNPLKPNSLSSQLYQMGVCVCVFYFGRKPLLQEIICFLFAIHPSVGPSHAQQRQSLRASFFLLPLRSNISVVQSIVLDRQLLELELGHLVTDNMACLFNFLLGNSVAPK